MQGSLNNDILGYNMEVEPSLSLAAFPTERRAAIRVMVPQPDTLHDRQPPVPVAVNLCWTSPPLLAQLHWISAAQSDGFRILFFFFFFNNVFSPV